ncbi:GyrI-like domain-containing protein [Paenibacillus sp. WQ 127069]|uniref:GyrI-like domain-containing protein n=1 Tax=Paenibacillus baimaensis TaxID=2982185 RepID=A0ABT2UCC9_9BACL|nr:GyrI-like domain-containing protein [Paenibacillus sp. WQ 127069]MCU6792293.1 GyrI-like domain-containing protein [Paenibacillus sp. WQ 127069]
MRTYQVDTVEKEEIKLVGFSITESLNNVLETKIVRTLREDLTNRMIEIENRKGPGVFLIQIYPHDGQWTPHVPFQHVVAFEVTSYGEIPTGMITHTVSPGQFIKIIHKGAESQIGTTYDFINKTYGVRPIDIEYWNDIHTLENQNGEIDIYIPTK